MLYPAELRVRGAVPLRAVAGGRNPLFRLFRPANRGSRRRGDQPRFSAACAAASRAIGTR
ncbi:hypothetical protein BWD40_06070 [Sphingopyxis granuli]|nr:hypothetical protein BWD40_06070 [Sphingopyxis granuli]